MDRKSTKDETLALYRKLLANANQLIRKLTAEKDRLTAQLPNGDQVLGNLENNPEVFHAEQEPRDALSLLPEEMWAMILDNVEDQKDLHSCYNTCQLFQDILEKDKNVRLFQEVYPLLEDYLSKTDQLKCRQVCKGWKKKVDTLIPVNHVIGLPLFGKNHPRQLVLEEMKSSGIRNLFPMRRVLIPYFWVDDEEEPDEYLDDEEPNILADIKRIFVDFGDQIEFLWLEIDNSGNRMVSLEVYEVVLFALAHCRSLKRLKVSGVINHTEYRLDDINEQGLEDVMPVDFSISPKLEFITIEEFRGFDQVLRVILERCSNQVKRVKTSEWNPFFAGLPWNSLQELDLGGVVDENRDLEIVHDVLQMTAQNLTKLTIDCEACMDSDSLESLIKVGSHFPKLNYLQLVYTNNFTREAILSLPKGLLASPSLKTLEFQIDTPFLEDSKFRYGFLLFFPSVQTLNLKIQSDPEEESKVKWDPEFVQLSPSWLRKEKIYESNVWELMPCLETIALGEEGARAWETSKSNYKPTYTRAGYNAYQKRKLN